MSAGGLIALAVGCAFAGGNTLGATVVGMLNHGWSMNGLILIGIGIVFTVGGFVSGREAIREIR